MRSYLVARCTSTATVACYATLAQHCTTGSILRVTVLCMLRIALYQYRAATVQYSMILHANTAVLNVGKLYTLYTHDRFLRMRYACHTERLKGQFRSNGVLPKW
jgi:hypothetical protein